MSRRAVARLHSDMIHGTMAVHWAICPLSVPGAGGPRPDLRCGGREQEVDERVPVNQLVQADQGVIPWHRPLIHKLAKERTRAHVLEASLSQRRPPSRMLMLA